MLLASDTPLVDSVQYDGDQNEEMSLVTGGTQSNAGVLFTPHLRERKNNPEIEKNQDRNRD